jgi:hypothetical protein
LDVFEKGGIGRGIGKKVTGNGGEAVGVDIDSKEMGDEGERGATEETQHDGERLFLYFIMIGGCGEEKAILLGGWEERGIQVLGFSKRVIWKRLGKTWEKTNLCITRECVRISQD